jgi:hypothetical protein
MLYDRASIAGTARITKDGYFVADALVARANNIQEYFASEIGLIDRAPQSIVRVFRPEVEVFARDALASLAHRPVTLDHPASGVSAENWKSLAVGDVGGDVVRDGEFVRVPIKIMDASAIDSVKTDRREFSLGYTAQFDMTPGEFNGQAYDGVARSFRYNHLAAVRAARGGTELRIVDERSPAPPQEKTTMKIKIGDAEVDATNGEAVRIAVDALNAKLADSQTKIGTLTADLATANKVVETKDGEIAALAKKVEDAAITPEKLQALADARADVVGKAKALKADIVTDGKTDADIRKEAVTAKLGDAAKDMSDDAVAGAFAAFTKDVKPADPLRNAIIDGVQVSGDEKVVKDARAAMIADMTGAKAA